MFNSKIQKFKNINNLCKINYFKIIQKLIFPEINMYYFHLIRKINQFLFYIISIINNYFIFLSEK